MIEKFQIKGLEKLANSGLIKSIYPMVDHIDIYVNEDKGGVTKRGYNRLDFNIYLNDPSITSGNMYEMEFDPHYLIDRHIKQYLPYINIDKVAIDFIVWGPEGDIIYSWNN